MSKHERAGGGDSPSTKKTKDKSGEVVVCVKCSKNVVEDSIECESCLKWEHRVCAGISKEEYEVLSGDLSTNIMFFCSVCRPKVKLALKFFNEIEEKQKSMGERVKQLEEELKSLVIKISQLSNQSNTLNVSSMVSQNASAVAVESQSKPSAPRTSSSVTRGILPGERKFNLVIHGIAECPKATPRSERQKSDLASCLTVVSKLNADINTHSVCDCLRLGNYKKESSRPRPILLKLNHSFDVSNVLANRAETPQGITIKPDQAKEKRQRESLLLDVHWKLMQMGTDKKDIKIRASTVYLKGNKHAQVVNNCLQYFNSPNQTTSVAVDSVTNPISTDSADQMDHSSHEDVHPNTSN